MYLVVIAAIIIIPISLYIVSQWMGNFAYQTNTNYLIFAVVGILALLFSFITVAFHSLKTARMNPVNSFEERVINLFLPLLSQKHNDNNGS